MFIGADGAAAEVGFVMDGLSTQCVSAALCCCSAADRFDSWSSRAAFMAALSMASLNRPCGELCSNFLFLLDWLSESGEEVADAAARCINFIVNSLDETALGVSGAMVEICALVRVYGILKKCKW